MGIFDFLNAANLVELFHQGKQAEADRTQSIRVAVSLDPETPKEIAAAIKEALVPETPEAMVCVNRLEPGERFSADPSCDVALVLCGGSTALCHDAGIAWLGANVPTLMVGRSSVEVPGCTLGGMVASRLLSSDPRELVDRLGHWIVASTGKEVAFAANFPFCRRATAQNLIHAVAVSNAAVATFNFIPGVFDFAMVTANEFKLALDLASVYDQQISFERLPEIISIVAFGAVVRTVAGIAEKALPKLGWLIRGASGFSGAVITGNLLVARFEGPGVLEGPLGAVLARAKDLGDLASEKIGQLTGDVVKLGPDALYFHPKTAKGSQSQASDDVEEATPQPGASWIHFGPSGAVSMEGA